MFRRKLLAVVMATGLFVVGTAGTSQAAVWRTIVQKNGHGRVTIRAWTRNYNQVAFVASHAGTRISVSVVVNCKDGDHFDKTWSDGGGTFRFVLGGLGNSGRCDHTFKVTAKKASADLATALLARG